MHCVAEMENSSVRSLLSLEPAETCSKVTGTPG